MSAPPQGFGGSGGGLSPSTFLGTYSGSNPSNPANGYWWYRADTGQIWANINGSIMPIQSTGSVTIIGSNTTIANTDVFNDIIVLPNATLTIYGNIIFHGNVTILNGATLLSSNPNASSSSPATNDYLFLGNFYLNGTYEIAQYNTDNINSITLTTINSESGANPTISGSGTLNIGSNITLTISENITVTVSTISGSGTLVFSSGYTVTIPSGYTVTFNINSTMNASISGSGTLNIGSGYTLALNINYTVTSSSVQFSGSGTLTIGSGYTLTINNNITWTLNLAGSGTLSVGSGYTLTVSANISVSIPTISGSGTLSVSSGYTLTVNANVTWTLSTLSGAGTLTINSGYTLTISANVTISISTVSGAGTLSVASGYTLTVSANSTWSISTISGAGTLSVISGYTLTQGGAITISIASISIAGTWANAGYGITIPSGATVTVTVTGSFTTASTAGTLTVNGTCYWFGAMNTGNNSTLPSFPLNLAGSGILVGAPSNSSSGGNSISLNNTSISANGTSGSTTSTGIVPYYKISSLSGSATGKYGIGHFNATSIIYVTYVLIYIGTANTTFNINSSLIFASNGADNSGKSFEAYNAQASAGTITITGTLYV